MSAVGSGSLAEAAASVGRELLLTLGDLGGSILGTLIPIPFIGTILGGLAGRSLAGLLADNIDVSGMGKAAIDMFGGAPAEGGAPKAPGATPTAGPKPIPVKDALIRPGQPPITFDKGDLIMAGTNLEGGGKGAGGGGGSSEIASLLKQLIAKVDQPVHVNIGGRVMDEIEKQTSLKKTYTTKTDKGYSAFG